MAYAPSTVAARDFAIAETPAKTRPGFFRWFFEAMVQSRQRQADREIARFLDNGKFTDEAEREIERRFFIDATTLLNCKEIERDDYASNPRADGAFAHRFCARDFVRYNAD